MPAKRASAVQIMKNSCGDIVLMVSMDKKTAAKLKNKSIAVAVAEPKEINKIICGARYDNFRIREELIRPAIARIRR